MSAEYDIAELFRRLANLIRIGTVEEVDPGTPVTLPRARVKLGDLVTAPLPWVTGSAGDDRDWCARAKGEQVVVVSPDGDLGQGIILGALYQLTAMAPSNDPAVRRIEYADGTVFEYDKTARLAKLEGGAGVRVEVTAPGGVTINGDLEVDGNVSVSGDVSALGEVEDLLGALSRLRTNYNAHTHVGNLGAPTSPGAPPDVGA